MSTERSARRTPIRANLPRLRATGRGSEPQARLARERAHVAGVGDRVEGYAEHYARTLTHWIERLDAHAPEAERLAGAQRLRVWRLYLRAARSGFRTGFTSIYQVHCRRA